jgi:drug/metabolite transporter (DMT)-like permease
MTLGGGRVGIAIAVAAYTSLATESVVIHQIGDRVGTFQIALLRAVGCAILMAGVSIVTGRVEIRSIAPRIQITRSALGAGGFLGAIYAFGHMPLIDATALAYTRGVFMTLFAVLILREAAGSAQWLGVSAGMIGALLIIRPGFTDPNIVYAAAILSPAMGAAAAAASKKAILADSVNTTMWWVTGANLLLALPALAMPWRLEPDVAPALLAVMILGPAGTYALLWSIRYAPISKLAPFEFTRLIVAAAAALVLFQELPTLAAWCGIAAIIIGCLLQTLKARHHDDTRVDLRQRADPRNMRRHRA